MLNTIGRVFARPMLRRLAGTLTRQFSDEPRAHIMAGDHSDSLDFLQNDFIKEEDIPELSLDADVDYLEAIVDKADENEFLYRASEANQKLEIFTSDDFEKLIKHQYAILGFNFSEFMKIADYGLLEKAQRMIDSRDISLAVKVRLVSHIKQLQTNKNILAIFKSALDQAFEDEFKEIEILVLASANQSQPLSEALRHMVVQASNLDKLKKPSFFLLSMMAIFIPESTKEFVEAALTGSKKRIGQAIQIVDQFSESDSLNTIMTDKSLAAVLNNAGFCRLSLLLQIIEIYMKRQNASPEDCIDLLMTLNPALKVDLLLDYPTELLMKISRDQKMILYWLFSKNLMNLKLKEDPHRTKLIDLVDNLLLFDDSSTNYLCRLMMLRANILPNELKRKIESDSMNNSIIDNKDILMRHDFVHGCSIFGLKKMLTRRGDMLRVLAAGQQIYNSLPNVGLKSQLLLNLNSFIMMLERQKRLTFVDLMSQTLSSIDPSNLEHLESICDMAISMLERSRLMNFTIYIHDETLENQLRRVVEQCLHAHQDLISTLATKSSAKIDPSTRDRLVMVCLLAKIKFNIGSPVINHMGRLLKTMNDLTFAWCFSAFQTRDHLQCLLHELKLRLKDSSCFSLHLVNTIIGSFYFRSMAGVLMLNPEKRKIITDSTYVKDLTFEQLLALPTIQNPKFLEESEMLLVFLPNLMACIEKYFLGIVQQNKFKIVRASYADSFLAKDIFSPNDYRNQRWAFAMLTPNRFFVSVEEISVFFRLCSQLNYNSLGLWLAFEKILIQMLESELVVAKEKNNGGIVISLGILGNLTKVCNSQKVRSTKVWELIEKYAVQMLDGPIFAQHLECFRVIAHNFALANKYFQFTYRGSAEFWAIIEALTRAAYEAKAQDYIVWPLVNSMIRKNCIIDRNWINKVLADMKSRADTDKHLIYIVKSCSPRLVERENYREMLDFAQNLLQKMELGVSPEMPSHMKDVMLKVLKTKTRQFSNALALMKSPEERHAYEEQMLLELD